MLANTCQKRDVPGFLMVAVDNALLFITSFLVAPIFCHTNNFLNTEGLKAQIF